MTRLVVFLSAAATVLASSTCSLCALVGSAAASVGPRVHLRGVARIDAHAARSQGKLVLRGVVTDDAGDPAPNVRLAIAIATESLAAGTPLDARAAREFLPLGTAAPQSCGDAAQGRTFEIESDRAVVTADDTGRFCLRLALPLGPYVAHIEALQGGLLDGSRIDLPVDLGLEPVTLRFDPERRVLALDDATVPIDVVASTEDDGLTAAAVGLPLVLSNESGRTLGTATTNGSGRARFAVPGALLGAAGQGELRIAFGGSARAGPSAYSALVERTGRVELTAPDAIAGRLPEAPSSVFGDDDHTGTVRVVARTICASRGCTGPPTGTVEVRLGDGEASRVVGAASLERGEARVVATFAASGDALEDTHLTVDYVPDAPWFEPTGELELAQPLHPPHAWKRIAFLLAGVAVAAWLAVGRLPRGPREKAPGSMKVTVGQANVELLRPAAQGVARWSGHIVDGHEGTGVAGARVWIERPTFDHAAVAAETTTDADGAFVLLVVERLPGDRLVAEGPLHAALHLPVPPFGEIRVALVSRRRALLDRLVAWARRRGRPFDTKPEPTPGHVRRTARSSEAVKTWAEAVEHAAYSGATIDARHEAEVDRLAPDDAAPARDGK